VRQRGCLRHGATAAKGDRCSGQRVVVGEEGVRLADPMLNRVLTAPKIDLHIRRVMDEGRVLLVNLGKGQIGEDSSSLLGGLLVTTIGSPSLPVSIHHMRNALAPMIGRDFSLVLSEAIFQTFMSGESKDGNPSHHSTDHRTGVEARLSGNETIVKRAATLLKEGLPTLALDALFQQLAETVGADDPANYSLDKPYSYTEIEREPYLRLRFGFTYENILKIFRHNYSPIYGSGSSIEFVVSALLDNFIDRGAVVPTFTWAGDCARIYRKGEANPDWDEEIDRFLFTLEMMDDSERRELIGSGRTRIAKINAIMAFSGKFPTALTPGAFERGNVGLLKPSIVEREGGELSRLLQRFGHLS
jgi:hypothetical protein